MFHWDLNTSPIIASECVSECASAFPITISTLNQESSEEVVHRCPLK